MQSGERELSFGLHAVRAEHHHTERLRSFRGRGEHRRLANPGFAAENERSAMVSQIIDDPIQPRQLLVPPEERLGRTTDLAD